MLELRNITKFYDTGAFKQMALNGISLEFVPGDIVAILGPSGCGKTTLLNIIGGLDRYTDGDLIINGVSTKQFKDVDWDAYRNNSIGFVFQSYNLINHITVLDNVEMALTLSGVPAKERKEKALAVLDEVGLIDHLHKRPNQLSGGQKQRVAIARAIVNDPDIILMDEPTGALDSKTSIQILELVKKIAKGKLVIMVTHNPALAEKYATRIVKLHDGVIIDDSKPVLDSKDGLVYQPKKTSMNFLTALKLSFNNLRTKLGRAILTSFAASIGIIGIALVLAIANGFNAEIDRLEKESLSGMPITISRYSYDINFRDFMNYQEPELPEGDYIIPYNRSESMIPMHENKITKEYLDYVISLDDDYYESVIFEYNTGMYNLLNKTSIVNKVSSSTINFGPLPGNYDYVLEGFEILTGSLPKNENEVVVVTDRFHRIDQRILVALGIEVKEKIEYSELIGLELVSARNNDFYYFDEDDQVYREHTDLDNAYNNGFKLEVVGVLKPKSEISAMLSNEGIAFNHKFTEIFLEDSLVSDIVAAQKKADYDVKTGNPFNPLIDYTQKTALSRLGGNEIPNSITIYASDFDSKALLKEKLNEYNKDLPEAERIVFTDFSETFASSISTIIDSISIVLIAFAAISLVVSSIMIAIITYVSVLERTKEIGVLRSLGARKKDISRVFNAETFLIGLAAGILGVGITYLLSVPINIILSNALEGMMKNIANLAITSAIILIIISILLTLISGLIPARIAAKKDPVDALRMEN